MRKEIESQESAIERYIAKRNKKGKPLQSTGFLSNGGSIEQTTMLIISKHKSRIVFEGLIGQINIPLAPQKEIAFIKV